jgi:hypothetical protein
VHPVEDNKQQKENPRMKKAIVFVVALFAVVTMIPCGAGASGSYIGDVNTACGTNYTSNDCGLCHSNSANKSGYKASGACYLCPDAVACGGTSNPPPTTNCADYDNDGDGWTINPDCSPILDCNDNNINIYPSA